MFLYDEQILIPGTLFAMQFTKLAPVAKDVLSVREFLPVNQDVRFWVGSRDDGVAMAGRDILHLQLALRWHDVDID